MRSLTPETFSLLISLYSSLLSFFNAKGPSEIPCESEKFGDNNKVDYENDHQLVDCGRCRKVLKDFFFFFLLNVLYWTLATHTVACLFYDNYV